MDAISFNTVAATDKADDIQHQQQVEESGTWPGRSSTVHCTALTVTLLCSHAAIPMQCISDLVKLWGCLNAQHDYRPWYHWRTWAQLGIQCMHASAWISCLHPCPLPAWSGLMARWQRVKSVYNSVAATHAHHVQHQDQSAEPLMTQL